MKRIILTFAAIFTAWLTTGCGSDASLPKTKPAAVSAAAANLSGQWELILVNASHAVPETYDVKLTQLSNGRSVDSRIYPALQQMFDDARAQGVDPIVREGYRTRADQQAIMDEQIASYTAKGIPESIAEMLAADRVAQPGTSEHELGLAVDINAKAGSGTTNEQVYAWLKEHAPEYGFILRYPEGKSKITGISYEPWHYRYVGTEHAMAITESGLTLEEYLAEVL